MNKMNTYEICTGMYWNLPVHVHENFQNVLENVLKCNGILQVNSRKLIITRFIRANSRNKILQEKFAKLNPMQKFLS